MDPILLQRLGQITPEEKTILDGRTSIDRELYMHGRDNRVNSAKLLAFLTEEMGLSIFQKVYDRIAAGRETPEYYAYDILSAKEKYQEMFR